MVIRHLTWQLKRLVCWEKQNPSKWKNSLHKDNGRVLAGSELKPTFLCQEFGPLLKPYVWMSFHTSLDISMLLKRKNCWSLAPQGKGGIPRPMVLLRCSGTFRRQGLLEGNDIIGGHCRRYCNPSLSSLFLFPEKLSCLLASCHAST